MFDRHIASKYYLETEAPESYSRRRNIAPQIRSDTTSRLKPCDLDVNPSGEIQMTKTNLSP
jgi:hypothetical protein